MLVPRTLAAGVAATLVLTAAWAADPGSEPARPAAALPLFNGKDLTGLTTWLKDTKADDPRRVFSVRDGLVSRKDTYVDWMTYQAQTGVSVTEHGGRLLPASA